MGSWQTEIVTFIVLFIIVAIIGGFTGLFFPLLFLLTLILLIYQVIQINRFEHWIGAGGKNQYPKAKGIWEDIYYHHYRIKKAEKKRKKQLGKMIDQFRQSTEALPDAAVVLGVNDEIEWVNKVARGVLGLQQADKGQRIPNLIRFPEFIRYLKQGDYSQAINIPSPVNKDLTLAVRIVAYGKGLRLLLAQDVTQLKKMELMRKDFVANVSHELRTPLTVLKGYLETLQDMEESAAPVFSSALQQMQLQTERMQHLVDDLLLLNRLETKPKKTETVNIPQLLHHICQQSDNVNQGASRIDLSVESAANLQGDEQELRSAFTNLIENALKYSPADSMVNVRWYQEKTDIVLAVQDSGEGIAAANILRVTERFYRCDVKRDKTITGTGLGLAIVKHVLLRHDACLKIASTLHKGSCFSCHFPVGRISNPNPKETQ
jgi:two-component system, OmpR family, phosphate regulon sensor histidine kinase PhoR